LLRSKAVIANSPIVDLRRYMLGLVGGGEEDAAHRVAGCRRHARRRGCARAEAVVQGVLPRFGVTSLAQWIERLKTFNAVQALGRLSCPALALVGTGEGDEAHQQFETLLAHVWPCDAARV